MIGFKSKGDYSKAKAKIEDMNRVASEMNLDRYGREGVQALQEATPKKTGLTASSWEYKIIKSKNGARIEFHNTNTTDYGLPIVFLLTYGHMTKGGWYVEGLDFINPALRPVFEEIAKKAERELNK